MYTIWIVGLYKINKVQNVTNMDNVTSKNMLIA